MCPSFLERNRKINGIGNQPLNCTVGMRHKRVLIHTQYLSTSSTCTGIDKQYIYIRPRNNNWQDWKYTSFVVFVSYSQNIRRHKAMCRDEHVVDVVDNIGLKLRFSSWFSIHLLLHQLYRFYYKKNSIYKCAIIESYVFHRSVSHWESVSCKSFLYSLRKQRWIETQLWKGNFNPMFLTTSATMSHVTYIVTSQVFVNQHSIDIITRVE